MVHFMAEKSHFCNLFAALLNITPKPELLKFHFFTDINKNFTCAFYNTIKSHKEHATTGLTSCFTYNLFICELIYNMFLFNY